MFKALLVKMLRLFQAHPLLLLIAGFHLVSCQHSQGPESILAIRNSFPQAFIEPQLLPSILPAFL